MMNIKTNKILKTATVIALAVSFSSVSNAGFFGKDDERKMRMTPEGQMVPDIKESWISKATTYHTEYKPKYNPETQRVQMPVYNVYNGGDTNTESETVKPAWYDRATTYHEEERRPWNPYSNETKDVPAYMYYDKKEARAYNEFYNQEDLKPVPYMYGSASLVLRKSRKVEEVEMVESKNLDGISKVGKDPMDIRMVGMNDVYVRPAGGFDSIDQRDANNQMAMNRSNFITMSEPVEKKQGVSNYNNVMIGSPKQADVQAVTKIDKPSANWRDKLETKVDMSRPGDFDYKPVKKTVVQPYAENVNTNNGFEGGEVIAATGGEMPTPGNYNNYAAEKVNNYIVEDGDTLSEISDKEKIYGDWTLWPLIYDANRTQVQDPDLIEPGQDLDIPRNYNVAEEDDARYRSQNREMPISLYDGK